MPYGFSSVQRFFFHLFAAGAILTASCVARAALVDFSAFSDAQRSAVNGLQNTLSKDGIGVTAARYQGNRSYTIALNTTLWIRDDADDHGLGVCSEGLSSCGGTPFNPLVDGRGDWNELGNNYRDEVIRLQRPDNSKWSDLWVSSLDTKTGWGRESGRVYWSDVEQPNLSQMSWITINQDVLGWAPAKAEGSIFDYLISQGFDAAARYVFFRADVSNGFDNDYLVYQAGVSAVPVPSSLLLLGSAVAAMGFVPRRRR